MKTNFKLLKKIGFTDLEAKTVLVLIVLLLIGIAVKHFKNRPGNFSKLEFDYSKEESLFERSMNLEGDADSTFFFVEKSIDSKHELLDFRQHENKQKTGSINKIDVPININDASIEELVHLPGIGEKTALSIFNYRIKKGKFNKIEELLNIKGIGKAKFDKIKNLITI
ncbi:MAG: helix-hairpin-helix domain-containing protein [Melioribacteraceae bacterium]|jgi:competence protein ComEA|nr:helix-hairpin-helix domain-containing protein [Melioribacteraceae bacterium]